ncbi:MAG: metal ABC transporter permease [Deltaproteobacteria bacterium]
MEYLLEPLGYQFFVRGLVAALFVGALCGLVGVYVVLRRMSYIGHGLSHAVFGGAVASYVVGLNFYIGATIWGFAAAFIINEVTRQKKIGADAAIGIVTTASFAIGVALISRAGKFTTNFEAALFGNILGVTREDVAVIIAVAAVVALCVFLFYKQLLFTTFDEEVARAFGVNTRRINILLSFLLAASIIASIQVLGVTLIAASIIAPAITARLLTDSFGKLLVVSALIGSLTAVVGMYLSYYLDIASGASIVLLLSLIFAAALGYKGFGSNNGARVGKSRQQ